MAKTTKAKGKKENRLNPQQKRFYEAYLATCPRNGTRAYMDVYGVKDEKVAAAAASRLLKSVKGQEYLQRREKEIFSKRFEVSQERIATEIAAVANARASDFYHFDGQKVTFKSFEDIPEDLHGAIKSVKVKQLLKGIQEIEVTFHDKPKALEMLARHKQMFNDKSTHVVEAGDTLKAFLETISGQTIGPPSLRKT